jgi:uncharacterized membrane protein (UPF0182 family)
LPVLFIKDIPPVSSAPELKVERPEIYFGELSNDRVYVKTTAKEFNYPAGEQNVFANYEGAGRRGHRFNVAAIAVRHQFSAT